MTTRFHRYTIVKCIAFINSSHNPSKPKRSPVTRKEWLVGYSVPGTLIPMTPSQQLPALSPYIYITIKQRAGVPIWFFTWDELNNFTSKSDCRVLSNSLGSIAVCVKISLTHKIEGKDKNINNKHERWILADKGFSP